MLELDEVVSVDAVVETEEEESVRSALRLSLYDALVFCMAEGLNARASYWVARWSRVHWYLAFPDLIWNLRPLVSRVAAIASSWEGILEKV